MDAQQHLIEFVQSEKRVCPKPDLWYKLWGMLPNKQLSASGWSPPLPLILGAWGLSSDWEKRSLVKTHITYAAQNGALEEVATFLLALAEDQWVYEGEV